MRMSVLVVTAIIVIFPFPTMATVHNVQQDGSGDFTTIQAALSFASDGDEIIVGPGTWTQPVLTIDKNISLNSEAGLEMTILDGDNTGRLLYFTLGSHASVNGFTFTRANLNYGAALHVDYASVVEFSNCLFTQNNATYVGGVGFVRHPGSDLTFRDCQFIDNHATLNAGCVGISIQSRCHFFDCYFEGNTSLSMAGALANFDGALMEVSGCVFVRNKGGECGAIRIYDAPGIIENNTFVDHTSEHGTIFVWSDHLVIFRNNIVEGEIEGYGLYRNSGSSLLVDCNLYYGNSQGSMFGVDNNGSNLFEDPLFCEPFMDDYSLCDVSPAIESLTCGLIGALSMGCENCGPVSINSVTWGSLKAVYR